MYGAPTEKLFESHPAETRLAVYCRAPVMTRKAFWTRPSMTKLRE